jgi:hypothetical protein
MTEIKSRRIEWLMHVLRMESSRVPQKKILNERPEGKRNTGRLRVRWPDDDVNDLRNIGVGNGETMLKIEENEQE